MIIPKDKLLGWTALIVVPSGTLIGMVPSSRPVLGLLVALFATVAAIDAARSRRRLGNVSLTLTAVTHLAERTPGRLALAIDNPGQRRGAVFLGLAWPDNCVPDEPLLAVSLEPGRLTTPVLWPCRAGGRGAGRIREYYLGADSPLGWWLVRRRFPAAAEIRVYPSVRSERRAAASFLVHRRGAGLHALRQIGQGREFEKLRDYQPGDGYENIHWKATARHGRPVTKVYRTERTQEIYAVIDASRLSGRPAPGGKPGETYLDRFIAATLLLSLTIKQQGDLFGLVTFSDKVDHFLRAGSGLAAQQGCREALSRLAVGTAAPDFEAAASAIRLRQRKRSLCLFMTSLDDPVLSESLIESLEIIRRQHLVVVATLTSDGMRPLFSEPLADGETVDGALAGHLFWRHFSEACLTLRQRGIHSVAASGDEFSAGLVERYLSIKQRQLI